MSAIDLSLGCIFIGVMLNVWLYGFTCVQTYIYFTRFKADRRAMKVFVTFLFIADSANSILDAIFLYKYLVTNYGIITYAMRSNDEFATDPLCVSVIGFATQLFFAWRIWRLLLPSRWAWVPPAIIFVLGLLSFLGALGTTIGVVIIRTFSEFQRFEQAVIVWLACTAAADVVVTISLVATLHRARTGFTKTDDIITRLIRNTLQTGLLTSSFAVIDLILFLSSTTTLHLVFNLPLSKLYVNSLLSTLNARQSLFNNKPTAMHDSSMGFRVCHSEGSDSCNLKSMEAGVSFNSNSSSPTDTYISNKEDFSPSTPSLPLAPPQQEEEKDADRRQKSLPRSSHESRRIGNYLQPWSKNGSEKDVKASVHEKAKAIASSLTGSNSSKRPGSANGKRPGSANGKNTAAPSAEVHMVTVEEKYRSSLPSSDHDLAASVNATTTISPSDTLNSDVASPAEREQPHQSHGQAIQRQQSLRTRTSTDQFGKALMAIHEDVQMKQFLFADHNVGNFSAHEDDQITSSVASATYRHPYSQM